MQAHKSGERVNVPVTVHGFCYHYSSSVPVIKSEMTLSMKSFGGGRIKANVGDEVEERKKGNDNRSSI